MLMKYVLGVFGFIILTIVAVVLLATTIESRNPNLQEGEKTVKLADYTDRNASVTYITQGRIVGNEDYREIRITVTQRERKIEVIRGYSGSILKQQTTPNTADAFEVFAKALDAAGYSREKNTPQEDMSGVLRATDTFIPSMRVANRSSVTGRHHVAAKGASAVTAGRSNACSRTRYRATQASFQTYSCKFLTKRYCFFEREGA
jgi:hypothetical protein